MDIPVIQVHLTDEQYKQVKDELTKSLKIEAIQEIVKNELEADKLKAPYLNKTDFAKWCGYSVNTINLFIKQGLPVAKVGTVKAIGKESFLKFMQEREQVKLWSMIKK